MVNVLKHGGMQLCAGIGLSYADFTVPLYRRLYQYATELYDAGETVGLDTIRRKSSENGGLNQTEERQLLQLLAEDTDLETDETARAVRDRAERLRLAHDLDTTVKALRGGAGIETSIIDVKKSVEKRVQRHLVGLTPADAFRKADLYRTLKVIPTGWRKIDQYLAGGFRGGNFVVVAGWAKQGKTCLLLNGLAQIAERGYHTAMISLEAGIESCIDQVAAREASLSHTRIREGISCFELEEARKKIEALPFHFEQCGPEEEAVLRAAERGIAAGARVIFIDYFQFVTINIKRGRNQAQGYEEFGRALKNIAKKTDAVVVLAAQRKQPTEESGKGIPNIYDIGDSSGLTRAADVLFFIQGPPPLEEITEVETNLWIAQRNGPGGKVPMLFHKAFRRFTER